MSGCFWFKWAGQVPEGAVKGGIEVEGFIYVGRAGIDGHNVPAKIVPEHNLAYFSHNGEEHQTENFDILCKGNSNLSWHECSGGAIPSHALAEGENAAGKPFYIGRAYFDKWLMVGKVLPSDFCCYIPYQGKEYSVASYEVLVVE